MRSTLTFVFRGRSSGSLDSWVRPTLAQATSSEIWLTVLSFCHSPIAAQAQYQRNERFGEASEGGQGASFLWFLLCLSASDPESRLCLRQNPVTDHFPTNTIKLTLSGDVPTVRLSQFLPTLPETHSIAVFVGAMARGSVLFLSPSPSRSVRLTWTCDFLQGGQLCGRSG